MLKYYRHLRKNDIKCLLQKVSEADVGLPSTLISYQEAGGEAMLEILTFLFIGLVISITINLALLCIIYIQWINSQIK